MPSDSGHSIEYSTNEADESLPALDGDSPDPLQGLIPVGNLVDSADAAITPIPDPIIPIPELGNEEEVQDIPNPTQGLLPLKGRPQRWVVRQVMSAIVSCILRRILLGIA